MLTIGLMVVHGPVVEAREFYKVVITRVDKNLYRADGSQKVYIETKYCHEYANREEAILKWEGRHGDNKLIFESGASCEVKQLR